MTTAASPIHADGPIRRILIIGGGTAGWSCAAELSRLTAERAQVVLVESEEIGIVGVGEATIPHIRNFNARIGIEESEFMRATDATIKLGIQFVDWGPPGSCYMHPFGETVRRIGGVGIHHHAVRQAALGFDIRPPQLSPATVAAAAGRFGSYDGARRAGLTERMEHAYHFDATRYAPLLRRHAVARGVQRIEGRVVDVKLRGEDGFIETVTLADGRTLAADLFVDCSGFRGLLIEGALSAGYEDWRHWLPCDRAVAAPCARTAPLHPYTQSTAEPAGWRWRIPLQHRIGNGYVFCSGFASDEDASRTLLDRMESPASATPRFLPFVTGHRRRMWFRNCVAIGLSSGFLEPLESTGIYLIQRAVMLLSELFPDRSCNPVLAETFDRALIEEFRQVRDFLVLHYITARRYDTPFWRHCRAIPLPDTLAHKLALFEERGVIIPYQHFFNEVSWRAVLLGQGVNQRHWDPRLDGLADTAVREAVSRSAAATRTFVNAMPSHEDYIASFATSPSA